MVFGSSLQWLSSDARVGTNRDARLAAINARRKAFYAPHPGAHRLPTIYLSNVTRDGWGNLAGPAFKATNVLGAAPFFNELVVHYCSSARPRDRTLRELVGALIDLYDVLSAAPMFAPDAIVLDVRRLCVLLGKAHQCAREYCRRAGVLSFPVTPKTYKVQHLPKLATCINPVRVQVYAEESMMGLITGTWRGLREGVTRKLCRRFPWSSRLLECCCNSSWPCD